MMNNGLPFKICRVMCLEMYKVKIVRLFLYALAVFMIGTSLCQTVFFLKESDLKYFLQYGSSYFAILYLMTIMICAPPMSDILNSYVEDIECFKSECDEGTVLQQNREECIYATKFLFTTTVLGIVGGLTFTCYLPYDKELIYILHLFEELPPEWEASLITGFRYLSPFMFYLAVACPSHCFLYSVLQFNMQKNVLLFYLRNINDSYEKANVLDSKAHKTIKEKLIVCLKLHINISRSTREVLSKCGAFVFLIQTLAIFFLAGIVTLLFMQDVVILKMYYLRLLVITINYSFWVILNCLSGQKIEDASGEIFDVLLAVKWYHWDAVNRQMYLMFLKNSLKQFKLKYSENNSINYQSGAQVVKCLFSIISVVNGLKQSKG